ncbi:MAG: M16 family metallopeptidase [Algoriphagus aquaeductus]|uniref:M16 family metallopeptidase n=1 Tax=Algoriphagus aquaeductus TaxID=475299 RepID=UPI0039194997
MKLDRSQAPEFKIPGDFEFINPTSFQLKSGIPLFFIPTPSVDAVKLEVVGKSKRSNLPLLHALVPSFTLQMLLEGTHTHSERSLSEFFDFHASEVHPLLSFSHEGLSLLSTKKHVFEVLPVFSSLFTEANFPKENIEKRKSQRKLSLQLEKEKSSSRASQLFRSALFGKEHPFGLEITESHVDLIQSELLQSYYDQVLWHDSEVFLCGNLSESEIESILSILESLPLRTFKGPEKTTTPITTTELHEERPDALQSSIRIGSWSIPKSHPDYFALSVFNTILGGYFGSRLVKNIREDKGHTYGISSSLAEIGDYNYWVIGADVQKAFKDEVIQEIHLEIRKLCQEPVGIEELEVVRNYLIGQMLSKFSTSFDLMDRFRAVHYSGLDLSFFQSKLNFLKTFTAEDLLRIGNIYFSSPPFVEVVVG